MAKSPQSPTDEPILAFTKKSDWHRWLVVHHTEPFAVLLRIAKKGAPPSITYAEALDVALAWGWIDSQKRGLDGTAFLQRFSRRKPKSPWSKINCAKAEALIASGAMQAPGLVEVTRAREDGRWDRAYAGARTATVPEDLAAALAENPRARAFFEALDSTNRYAILYRIGAMGTPATRASRITKFVAMCAADKTIHPLPEKRALKQTPRSRPT